MGLRYEAWTFPWSGDFHRKVAKIPVVVGSGDGEKRLFSTGGDGSVDMAIGMGTRISEIVSDTVGSLIRVFDGTSLIDEWICDRVPKDLSDQDPIAPLSGSKIESVFDGCIVYAREYPDIISKIQDYIWGGKNILTDPSMEESEVTSEKYEVWRDATGGTFTLTVMSQTTASINWNQDAATVETRLQALSNVDDVVVTVGDGSPGSESNPWQIEFVNPAVISPNMTGTDSLTGGAGTLTIKSTESGTDDAPAHWTKSQFADRRSDPALHGQYASDGFRRDDTHAHSGTYGIRINGLTRYAGGQQVANIEPGMTYQGGGWIYTEDATETYKVIARDIYETALFGAQASGLGTDNAWKEFGPFEVFVGPTAPTDQIVLRGAAVGKANPAPFWIDDFYINEGYPQATPGEIMRIMMEDAQIDHAADPRGPMLEWIDISSFSDTLDSNGAAWSSVVSFTAQVGETYGQLLDKFTDLGFEWDLVAKAGPITPGNPTHDLKMYNSGGRDSVPATAINIRQGTTGGQAIHRRPDFTAIYVEGETSFYEAEGTGVANFGRWERFMSANDVGTNADLALLGDQALAAEEANRHAITVNVAATGNHPRPLVAYRPGDTLPIQMPPHFPKESRRVQTINYVNTEPTTYQVVGSRVLGGEAAAYDLIWRLWRKFDKPMTERRSGKVAGSTAKSTPGTPTYFLAASNAPQSEKDRADSICTGDSANSIDSEKVMMYANLIADAAVGGRIVLGSGDFYFDDAEVTVLTGVTLQGLGRGATKVHVGSSSSSGIILNGGSIKSMGLFSLNKSGFVAGISGDGSQIEDCSFNDAGTLSGSMIGIQTGAVANISILNCSMVPEAFGAAFFNAVGQPATNLIISNCSSIQDIHLGASDQVIISGNHITGRITAASGASFVAIKDNVWGGLFGSPTNQISLVSVTGVSITGNTINGNDTADAIFCDTCTRVMIANNQIAGCDIGIWMDSCNFAIVEGNHIAPWAFGNVHEHGIRLEICSDSQILNNLIVQAGAGTHNTFDGIILDGDSNRNRVAGNRIMGAASSPKPRYGINVSASTCDDNQIVDNYIDIAGNFGTAQINDAGTGTILNTVSGPISQVVPYAKEGVLTTMTGAGRFMFPVAGTIVAVRTTVGTAPTGASLIVDVHKNGTTIFTTQGNRPTIAISGFSSSEAVPDVTAIADGDYITVDIDQIGSTVAGSDLTVMIEWRMA